MRPLRLVSVLLLVLVIGCSADSPTIVNDEPTTFDVSAIDRPLEGELSLNQIPASAPVQQLKALSWNVYVGTDLDVIMGATDRMTIPILVEAAWQDMMTLDFHDRAEVIAGKIAATRPHLIGLQEVTLLRTQSPGDAITGGTTPATDVAMDYLAILMDTLNACGMDYSAAAQVENWDAEMPRANPTFDDVRVTDFDVILARGDVPTDNAYTKTFDVILEVPVGGGPAPPIKRGFCAVDAQIGSQTLRFINTHFETQAIPPIQHAQAAELVAYVAGETRPTVVVGDLNSEGDGSTTLSHGMFLEAGFFDVSTEAVHPFDDGMTCCNEPMLNNAVVEMDQRIDHILYRPASTSRQSNVPAMAIILGTRPEDCTNTGYWASDHAGLVARFLVKSRPTL